MLIRKRILSLFAIIAMLTQVLGAIPITANAAEPHTHKVCSNADCSDNHEDITWTAWDSDASLPTEAGNYYLTKDITLNRRWILAGSTSLCLNGHTITQTNISDCVISMNTGYTFNLCDCIGSGTITGGKSGAIKGSGKSTFNMYGGKISGNSSEHSQDSGGICLSNSTFNMYGGEISGNTANYYGGGVGIGEGAFNMYGGKISGNTAKSGGGIWFSGKFKMLGGEISGNTATLANGNGDGGILFSSAASVIEIGGKVIIDNNTANDIASNCCLGDEHSIIISKPLTEGANIGITTESAPTKYKKINITGENDADYSTFFHSDNDDYKIINGENNVVQLELPEKYRISQQPTAGNGYTVIAEEKINEMWQAASPSYQWYEADIKVYNVASSESEVSENEIGAEAMGGTYNGSGVWQDEDGMIGVAFSSLNAGDIITVIPSAGFGGQIMAVKLDTYDFGECIENNGVYSFAPTEDGMYAIVMNVSEPTSFTAEITLTRTNKTRIDGQTAAALTAGENGKTYVCDVTFHPSGDNVTLSTTPVEYVIQHTHKVCSNADCSDNHEDITWTAWDSDTSLPSEAGNYYLTKDVTIDCEWNVPEGATNLCLNGYTLKSTDTRDIGKVIDILSNSELNLCDCSSAQTGKITGSTSIGVGFSRLVVGEKTAPVFNMYGGTISGINYTEPENPAGAAVDVSADNAEFHMYGGKITDNGAVGINMYTEGNVFLSGAVDISKNGSAHAQMMRALSEQLAAAGINLGNIGEYIDFSVQKGNVVRLEAPVTMANKSSIFMPAEDMTFCGTFTQGWNEKMSGKNPSDYFTSAADAFVVKADENGEAALIVRHTHSLTHYKAIPATCTEAGKGEYWKCEGENGCNKMFSDEDGKTEITEIPAGESVKGHKYGKWELNLTETATEVIKTCENDRNHQEKRNAEIQLVIPTPYIYSGEECKPKASVKVFEDTEEIILNENTDYTLAYENNINAGTATVKITGIEDYSGTVQRTFNIGAKTLTAIAVVTENKTYDGTPTVNVTAVTLDGVCEDDTVKVDTDHLTGTLTGANVGDYTQVTLSGLTLVNNENNNYILHQSNITVPTDVKIAKANIADVTSGTPLNIANNLKKEYTYILSRLCPQINEESSPVQKDWGNRSYEIVKVDFKQDGYYDDNTARIGTAESGGTVNNTLYLPIKFNDTDITGKVATVTIKISSDNYNDFTNTFDINASNKAAVTFGGIAAQDNVYNGSAHTGYTGELTITDSEGKPITLTPEIRYTGRLNTGYSERAEAPTDAGTYSVIFRVADTDENYIGKRTVNFEITKADGRASVTMADFEFGGTPSVPVPVSETNGTDNVTYMYKPQGAEDSAFKSDKPTAAGNYTVKAIFAETQNYKQAEATADFTINHDYSDKWTHDALNHWHECSCGSKADVAAHTWNEGTVTQMATCTLEGRTRYECTVCGREKVEVTKPLEHTWGAWDIKTEPSLTTTGTAERVCARNNEHKDIFTLPVLTDTTVWTEGTKVEPTETEDGSQEYTSNYGAVTITIPATGQPQEAESEVIIKDGTPNVTVDGLDELAAETDPTASKIKITMTIESKAEDSANVEHSAIKAISASTKIDYLDISLTKTVDTVENIISETARTLKIVIPFDKAGKKNIKVYRYHGDNAELLSEDETDSEYYTIGDGTITVYAKKFSTYAIGYDTEENTRKPSLGGGKYSGWKTDDRTPNEPNEPTDSNPAEEIIRHDAYIKGYEDSTFRPEENITRAETTAILARLTDGFEENESYTVTFPDIAGNSWYKNYIGFEESKNIITGYQDGTFQPEESITRAEFASMIARFAKLNTVNADMPFTDTDGHWASEQITACYEAGYIRGYEDNTCKPDNYITRAEAVAIINRVLYRNDIKDVRNPFSDVSNSHWAYDDIMEAAVTHNAN